MVLVPIFLRGGISMSSKEEEHITALLIKNRFDSHLLAGEKQEALKLIELAWGMELKLLAAEMVILMAEQE